MSDRNEEGLRTRLALLRAYARQLPAAEVESDLVGVAHTLDLFTSNAAELRAHIGEAQRAEIALKAGADRATLDKLFAEIDRLLHNFLAAAYTLAQHTMRVRDRHGASESFRREYEHRAPFDKPIANIVKTLRNDAQHARLPVVLQSITYLADRQPPMTFALVVGVSYLEALDLNEQTKAYVKTLGGDLPLAELVDAYMQLVENFVEWFLEAIVREHGIKLTELKGVRDQEAEVEGQLRDLTKNRPRGELPKSVSWTRGR